MTQHFQVAVLGSGPGGYIAALKAGQMGASVAIVEQHPFFGGTCLNWGCIPSKALLASAEMMHRIRHSDALGVSAGEPTFDWTKIQARKDKVIQVQRGGIKMLFGGRGVVSFHGRAALNGPGKVVVTRDGAETQEFTADNIILATGSTPARIPGWPTDTNYVCTSDEALHWKELPKRLVIIGGGVIGLEFACMVREFGVELTIVELMPSFLPGLDENLSEEIKKEFEKRGIKCIVETKVEDMKIEGEAVKITLSNGETLETDKVLVATGRRAVTANIGLETVGITTDRGFIKVNDSMETTAKGVYCIGDANGRIMLAHAASAMGVVAVENALGHPREFTAPVPSTIYTFPEMASVGITAEQARQKEIPVAIGRFPLRNLGKSMAVGETGGFVKVLRERHTGELLGVHMMGHNVTEIIASATAMLHQKITLKEAVEVIFAHPTISEGLHEAAEDALGMALHLAPKKVMRVTVGGGAA